MSEYNSQSRPVECYKFTISGYDPMFYTSDEDAFTGSSEEYLPLKGLSRSEWAIVPYGEDTADLTITVTAQSDIAKRCGLAKTPQEVRVRLRRYQRGVPSTPVMALERVMDSATVKGDRCELHFADVFTSGLAVVIPKNKVQPTCSWQLGDSNCGKDVSGLGLNVVSIAEVFANQRIMAGQYVIDGTWIDDVQQGVVDMTGGVITGVNDDVTQNKTVYEIHEYQYSNNSFRARVVLPTSFDIPLAGTTFTMRPGCDNSYARCARLENTSRFGAFPWVPTERNNPFQIRLDKKRKVS